MEAILAAAPRAAMPILNMDPFNHLTVMVRFHLIMMSLQFCFISVYPCTTFEDGGYAQKTPTGIRRTPSFQRPDSASRNQPGSSSTLPRKRSTIPSPVETRARHPSGSSASGVSPSPSGGFNGGGISAASR